jgi:hypothetical protein
MYHAIVLTNSLASNSELLEFFMPFAFKKLDSGSTVQGLEVNENDLKKFITLAQKDLKPNFYIHLYNSQGTLIVIFKNNTFTINNPDEIINVWEYGKIHNIPEDQLDFIPSSLIEEEDYFAS